MDNDDELWLIETVYKSDWDTRYWSEMYRGLPYGDVLRDYPKKAEPPIGMESVPNAKISFFSGKPAHPHLLLCVQRNVKKVLAQGFERIFRQGNVEDSRYRSKNASHITTGFNARFRRTQGSW